MPDPDDADQGADSFQSSRLAEASDEGISLDFLDIRPEDIRVEPGVTWTPPLAESSPREREPFPSIPPGPEPPAPEAASDPSPPINFGGLAGTAPATPAEPLVPPIQVESTRIAETRIVSSRSRDVVLPRSAVATWSLFVLLAQAFAFLAGLLAGHFLWRVH